MYHNMEHADIIRKMTEEFDEVMIVYFVVVGLKTDRLCLKWHSACRLNF